MTPQAHLKGGPANINNVIIMGVVATRLNNAASVISSEEVGKYIAWLVSKEKKDSKHADATIQLSKDNLRESQATSL